MPRSARVARLEEAAGTGEILTIVYSGGTQPGTKRDVTVIEVMDDGTPRAKMRALCLATGLPKLFFIDKVTIVDPDYPAPSYKAKPGEIRRPSFAPSAPPAQPLPAPRAEPQWDDTIAGAFKGAGLAGACIWALWRVKPDWAAAIPRWIYWVFVGLGALLGAAGSHEEAKQNRRS